ncbi:MAG: hypothetical protein HYT98_03285 [Candidatus Sungbacteria bacterium]|nr:hypothetical protein [Candidatus Sungbacteria bacterium]
MGIGSGEGQVVYATKLTVIQKALRNIEEAWNEMKTTPVRMKIEEFEKRILRQAKRDGVDYSLETGKWLDEAKKRLADSKTTRDTKNLILGETYPPETRRAVQKFVRSYLKLCQYAEWAYKDLKIFTEDKSKDKLLQAFLLWRVFLSATAFHKYYRLNPRGKKAKELYLALRPTVVFRTHKPRKTKS